LEESIVLSRIFLPRVGDAIVKMFSVPEAEEVDRCPFYNKSTVPFSAFIVNSPLLRPPKTTFVVALLILG
jgi:hypothetical protein